jgi:protocatechuate 3,4-dioxygenase beta subunit
VRFSDRIVALFAILAMVALLARVSDVALRPRTHMVVAPPPPVADEERDGVLEITVRDPAGNVVEGARVRAFWERDGRFYLAGSGATDAFGKVTLSRLPRGATWLIAEADGLARSSTQLVVEGGSRALEVELGAASSLSVTVTDEHETPIPRATVLVTTGDPLPFGALTGLSGVARFTRLSKSPWTVKASAPGYESVTQSGITGDITIALRRLASIRVVVRGLDDQPVPGASVFIGGAMLWPARRAETDGDGATRISGLLAGSYDLRATKGSLVSDTLYGYQLERGADDEVTLRLHAGRMVIAWVTDDDDDRPQNVPDADVVLAEGGLSSFPLRARTGMDGRAVLGPISAGPATLAAGADGYVSRSAVVVPDPLDGPVRIPLLRGGTLEGEVVDAKDRPVDGASIEVIGTDLDGLPIAENPTLTRFRRTHFEWALAGPMPLIPAGELGVMPGPIPPIPGATFGLAPEADVPSSDEEIAPWVTRFDGTFRAHPVTPGRVRALVRHPAYVEGVSDAVALAPGGTAKVKIVLLAGGTLEGRVVDTGGRGVSGARVDLTATRGTFERTTFTASDGTFAFAAVPAEVTIGVARPDDLSRIVVRKTVEVAEGGKQKVEITLPGLRDSVRVVVVDEDGRPVESAQVSVLSVDPNAPLRQTLFTDAEGAVDIIDARGLDVRIVVDAIGWALAQKNVEKAGEQVKVALSHGIIVEGKVTAIRGRQLVEAASVTLVSEGRRAAALTDRDGLFRVKDVAPGPIHVVVSHPDYANGELDALVVPTGRADRPFELPTIDLAEPGGIEGEVLDPAGKPVRGARVAAGVVPAYLPAGALPAGMVVTDAKGRFQLVGVSPGKVDVEAYAVDVGRGIARGVTVGIGRPTTGVTIRLQPVASQDDPTITGSVAVTLGERGSGDQLEVVVVQVAAASEAERAGVRAGDVIFGVDGVDVESMAHARARLSGPAGSDVVVEIDRGGQELKLRVGRESVRR